MSETAEDRARQAAAAKCARIPALAAAADKFLGMVGAHVADPEVAALCAGVLLDFAINRRAERLKTIID